MNNEFQVIPLKKNEYIYDEINENEFKNENWKEYVYKDAKNQNVCAYICGGCASGKSSFLMSILDKLADRDTIIYYVSAILDIDLCKQNEKLKKYETIFYNMHDISYKKKDIFQDILDDIKERMKEKDEEIDEEIEEEKSEYIYRDIKTLANNIINKPKKQQKKDKKTKKKKYNKLKFVIIMDDIHIDKKTQNSASFQTMLRAHRHFNLSVYFSGQEILLLDKKIRNLFQIKIIFSINNDRLKNNLYPSISQDISIYTLENIIKDCLSVRFRPLIICERFQSTRIIQRGTEAIYQY